MAVPLFFDTRDYYIDLDILNSALRIAFAKEFLDTQNYLQVERITGLFQYKIEFIGSSGKRLTLRTNKSQDIFGMAAYMFIKAP